MKRGSERARVLLAVHWSANGRTADEIAEVTYGNLNQVGAAAELHLGGYVTYLLGDDGRPVTRPTRSGARAGPCVDPDRSGQGVDLGPGWVACGGMGRMFDDDGKVIDREALKSLAFGTVALREPGPGWPARKVRNPTEGPDAR